MKKYDFSKPVNSKTKIFKKDLTKAAAYGKKPEQDGYIYFDATKPPFVIGGIPHPDQNQGEYYRLNVNDKEKYSGGNTQLALCTSGGTVRFATDAPVISIRVTNRNSITGMPHFTNRGVFGIDVYIGTGTNRQYVGDRMQTFADSPDYNDGYIRLPKGVKEISINLPLYGGVEKIEIGIPKKYLVGAPTPRTFKPIAFYGSSITQGGCVSRPGNSYANILCRVLDADCKNLGFSGCGMGELSIADFIGKSELSCFVMDYDYNALTVDDLKATHEPFYKHIRNLQPELPIIFLSHPVANVEETRDDIGRRETVFATYEKAIAEGDKNVYFVDGSKYFPKDMRDLYYVDALHPNDLGQYLMAKAIYPAVKKALLF